MKQTQYLTIHEKLNYSSGIAITERRPFDEIVRIAQDKIGMNTRVAADPSVSVKDGEIYFTYLVNQEG